MSNADHNQKNQILFFDGICIMCNRLVHFVLDHDRLGHVKFATLQGSYAENHLPQDLRADLTTVVFIDADGMHTKSDAIIRLLIAMGGVLRLAWCLQIFPRFFRNYVYDFVAHNRYRWFGTTEACALLTSEEKLRIID